MDNKCVACGDIIPEGRQVCPNCAVTSMKNIPCRKDCEERSAECHGKCERYLAWKQAKAYEREQANIQRMRKNNHYTYKVAKIAREERRH